MHFSNKGIQYRWPGGHFNDSNAGTHTVSNRLENFPGLDSDGVTATITIILVLQHDQ